MTDDKPAGTPKTAKTDPKLKRQERLNAALRDNLKKRKQQVNARKEPAKSPASDTESTK